MKKGLPRQEHLPLEMHGAVADFLARPKVERPGTQLVGKRFFVASSHVLDRSTFFLNPLRRQPVWTFSLRELAAANTRSRDLQRKVYT